MKNFTARGTFTALVTPFKNDGSVDFKTLQKLIDFQIKNKVEGIVVCGSTGEGATLTLKEKMAIFKEAVVFAKGRVPIIAATGTYETEESLNMTIYAREHGAAAALIVVPYYIRPTQFALFEHFRIIAASVSDLPIILYNIPGRTGVNMLAETQLAVANACPNVIATKEASGNLVQMMDIIKNSPKHFSLLAGDDSLALPVIAAGGKGIVSVISNYAPKKFGDMIRNALEGKFAEAKKVHYDLFEMMEMNFIEPNPAPVKCAMSLMKMIKSQIRMPLLPVSAENRKKIQSALVKSGLMKK
ncbi:MAG: 4-hydroxy-tetrahydrodipicolinate synthase [Ignavibacteriae bacterium]|nr:4-hydroxy-tetrahydrodipicolinate synthase [Ignavibacteriota bacterium]